MTHSHDAGHEHRAHSLLSAASRWGLAFLALAAALFFAGIVGPQPAFAKITDQLAWLHDSSPHESLLPENSDPWFRSAILDDRTDVENAEDDHAGKDQGSRSFASTLYADDCVFRTRPIHAALVPFRLRAFAGRAPPRS